MSRRVFTALALAVSLLVPVCSWAEGEECAGCHGGHVKDVSGSSHSGVGCDACHEGAAEHAKDPSKKVLVHFALEACGQCHSDQFASYTYSDNVSTKYGGSPVGHAKTADFANYNDIVDGHGFTKEYNEERGHRFMLLDHYDIKRGKFDTCLQCKSTKAAYYWNSGKEVTVESDVKVKAGHMKEEMTVPKGTKVRMSTAFDAPYPNTHEVQVLVTLPDGRKFASYNAEGATKDPNWTWSAIYAITVDGLSGDSPTRLSGNGCNHCHNPHKVGKAGGKEKGFRLIRKAQLKAIERRGGLNPYAEGDMGKFSEDAPLTVDSSAALCGQCHVEYVCGVSSIDKIDRDYFPWKKAKDLEADNAKTFPGYGAYSTVKHVQDWKQGAGPLSSPNAQSNGVKYNTPHAIGEALTKSQHPETETYWNSPHYGYGAMCNECHMPKVTKKDGTKFTSHWLASPYKYMAKDSAGPFAEKLKLKAGKEGVIDACGSCHTGKAGKEKVAKAQKVQDEVHAQALKVQDALVASLAAIEAAKKEQASGRPVNAALVKDAVEDHREAHVRWENLIISENSMGFHNPPEIKAELKKALEYAGSAKAKAEKAVK